MRAFAFLSLVLMAACGDRALPAQPSSAPTAAPQFVSLEAEAGTGEGGAMPRPQASGGITIHLAPGEHRQWTFAIAASQAQYAVEVTYSNDNIGNTETLSLSLDGVPVGAFEARDTGDDGEGWNVFVTNPAGHSLVIRSSGGDGCVEIDKVTLKPSLSTHPSQPLH